MGDVSTTPAGLVELAFRLNASHGQSAGMTLELAKHLDAALGHGIVKAAFHIPGGRDGNYYLRLKFYNKERWEISLSDFHATVYWGYKPIGGGHEKTPFTRTYHVTYSDAPPADLDLAAYRAWCAERRGPLMLRDFVHASEKERLRMSKHDTRAASMAEEGSDDGGMGFDLFG